MTCLILIFVSFALMAPSCIGATYKSDMEDRGTELARTNTAVAVAIAQDKATAAVAATQTKAARPTNTPAPTSTPTLMATATHTSTPQPVTTRVKVSEVATFKTFSVTVTKAQYQAPDPKGIFLLDLILENKTTDPLPYSAKNFSATSSAGKQKIQMLPKPQGSTWSDDFLPNSFVSPGTKAALRFLVEHIGIEKDFIFIINFDNATAQILLGY